MMKSSDIEYKGSKITSSGCIGLGYTCVTVVSPSSIPGSVGTKNN